MKTGDRVKVFEDPISCKKFEGDAILRNILSRSTVDKLQRWQIRFISDGFVCERKINIDNH